MTKSRLSWEDKPLENPETSHLKTSQSNDLRVRIKPRANRERKFSRDESLPLEGVVHDLVFGRVRMQQTGLMVSKSGKKFAMIPADGQQSEEILTVREDPSKHRAGGQPSSEVKETWNVSQFLEAHVNWGTEHA